MKSILKQKTFLYLTEFFAGMSVMAVELSASRLLAPYFSSSQIVWTIIIAAIMIAMALGNYFGGRSADRNPDPDVLFHRFLIASVWISAVPFLGRFVIALVTGLLIITVSRNLLILAALITCLVLFVYPCFLLGTCTPSLARYVVTGAGDSGTTVGTLGAFNTVGSIIGTFLPTFVTIPGAGTAVTFLIFSGVLLLLALIYFLSEKKHYRRLLLAVLLFLLFSVLGKHSRFAFWQSGLTYEGESVYNYLQVREDESSVTLSTNVLFGVQSILMKSPSLTGMYYDYALAAPLMAGSEGNILVLGMGTGTFARECSRYFPDMSLSGVEIDEKITSVAREYFSLPAQTEVITYDGRAFLNVCPDRYHVILVDAYQDITIPFQMSSREFFESVRDHLTADGVLVVNMNMRSASPEGINTWLSDTIASVFPFVEVTDVPGSTNRVLFASAAQPSQMLAEGLSQSAPADTDLLALMHSIHESLTPWTSRTHILTDDKAPVELLGMKAIDEIIREELSYYKEVFRREGFRGLLA